MQNPPKFTQFGTFSLEICHLATLFCISLSSVLVLRYFVKEKMVCMYIEYQQQNCQHQIVASIINVY
jgi:hypothetical protein